MLEALEHMSVGQRNTFSDVANRLLATTFLSRDKKDNKEAYYFLISYKEIFDEFFKIINCELLLDINNGSAMLLTSGSQSALKLKRDETILLLIIRVLYHEKMKETSLNENVVANVSDLHEKYDNLEIKRKINKTDLVSSLRLFRKYNLIEITGDIQTSSAKIVILPTILMAINSEGINEVYNTISKVAKEVNE